MRFWLGFICGVVLAWTIGIVVGELSRRRIQRELHAWNERFRANVERRRA